MLNIKKFFSKTKRSENKTIENNNEENEKKKPHIYFSPFPSIEASNIFFNNISDLSLWDNVHVNSIESTAEISTATQKFEIILKILKKLSLDKEFNINVYYDSFTVKLESKHEIDNYKCEENPFILDICCGMLFHLTRKYGFVIRFQIYNIHSKKEKSNRYYTDISFGFDFYEEKHMPELLKKKIVVQKIELDEDKIINGLRIIYLSAISVLSYGINEFKKAIENFEKTDINTQDYEIEICYYTELQKYLKHIYYNVLGPLTL